VEEQKKNDLIYMFSDGFADQFGGLNLQDGRIGGKKFLKRKLKDLLLSVSKKPLTEQRKLIEKTFFDWKGNLNQLDDVLLIGIKF